MDTSIEIFLIAPSMPILLLKQRCLIALNTPKNVSITTEITTSLIIILAASAVNNVSNMVFSLTFFYFKIRTLSFVSVGLLVLLIIRVIITSSVIISFTFISFTNASLIIPKYLFKIKRAYQYGKPYFTNIKLHIFYKNHLSFVGHYKHMLM